MDAPTRTCAICGTHFQARLQPWPGGTRLVAVPRRTCSDACASALRARNRTAGRKWTRAETEILLSLAGSHPFESLVRIYNQQASEQGLPRRTKVALRARLQREHGTVVPEYDGWTVKGAARLLGFTRTRLQTWVRQGLLEAPMVARRRVIRTQALRALARQRPELFGGADPDGLAYALDDADWAQQILRDHPRAQTHARPVVRLEDGRVFRCMETAAACVGRKGTNIGRAVRTGKPCGGYTWAWADAPQQERRA